MTTNGTIMTLVLGWLIQLAEIVIVMQLRGFDAGSAIGWLMLLALVVLAKTGLWMLLVIIVIQVVLSWLAPQSPVMPLLNSLTRPMLRAFQRRVPPIGNVDLSHPDHPRATYRLNVYAPTNAKLLIEQQPDESWLVSGWIQAI